MFQRANSVSNPGLLSIILSMNYATIRYFTISVMKTKVLKSGDNYVIKDQAFSESLLLDSLKDEKINKNEEDYEDANRLRPHNVVRKN